MTHPDLCYVFLATKNEVGIVKWGENGYYKTDLPNNYTKEIVAEMNEVFGTPEEIHSMVMCSMANLPETNEAWEKHYKMCMDISKRHNEKNNDE